MFWRKNFDNLSVTITLESSHLPPSSPPTLHSLIHIQDYSDHKVLVPLKPSENIRSRPAPPEMNEKFKWSEKPQPTPVVSCSPALVTILRREWWEIFRCVLGGNLSGHVSQEPGHNVLPPTLEKLKYELLAYEGAPVAIRWGECVCVWGGLLHKELKGTISEEWEENRRHSYKETKCDWVCATEYKQNDFLSFIFVVPK